MTQDTNTASGAAFRFTKKPVTIEAIQWTGSNLREVITFTDGPPDTRTSHAGMAWDAYTDLVERDGLKIYTLEGKMLASPGDWIIRGVKGELYPCKPDIFEATYTRAALAAAPVQPVAEPSYEHQRAIMEGERNASLDAYSRVIYLTGAESQLYEAGFTNGWQRASHGQAPAQPNAVFDEKGFHEWVLRNLPDDTIIGSSAYWADHLTAWAKRFVHAAPTLTPQSDPLQPLVALQEKAGMYADDFAPKTASVTAPAGVLALAKWGQS